MFAAPPLGLSEKGVSPMTGFATEESRIKALADKAFSAKVARSHRKAQAALVDAIERGYFNEAVQAAQDSAPVKRSAGRKPLTPVTLQPRYRVEVKKVSPSAVGGKVTVTLNPHHSPDYRPADKPRDKRLWMRQRPRKSPRRLHQNPRGRKVSGIYSIT